MEKGKKKYSETFKEQVVACYLTCLNYHEVARLMNISVNGVKSIVQKFKKKKPKEYARISTIIKKNTEEDLLKIIYKTMEQYENVSDQVETNLCNKYTGINIMSKLLSLMNRQDSLYNKRQKELYEAKTWALTYECKRLEKAILTRDSKELLKILETTENDKNFYEPLDKSFLVMNSKYSLEDYYEINKISKEQERKYNRQIEEFLRDRGYLKINLGDIENWQK